MPNLPTNSSRAARGPALDLASRILARMQGNSISVWTPSDFLDSGARAAVDKALQRLATSGLIRRIDRGLYDVPRINGLTNKPTNPDYVAIINAVARRDQVRLLVDGITAANHLGLTNAVPAHIVVHTDARLRAIHLGKLTIQFKPTAPSRLYWAGRPAMHIVQALHWLQDMMPSDKNSLLKRLRAILSSPMDGQAIREDLQNGLHSLPIWLRQVIEDLLNGGRIDSKRNDSSATIPGPRNRRAIPENRRIRRTRKAS